MSTEASPEGQLLEAVKVMRLHLEGMHALMARMYRRMLLAKDVMAATASFTTRTHPGEAVLSSLDKAVSSVESLAARAEAGTDRPGGRTANGWKFFDEAGQEIKYVLSFDLEGGSISVDSARHGLHGLLASGVAESGIAFSRLHFKTLVVDAAAKTVTARGRIP